MPRVLVDTIIVNVKAAQTSLHNHKMYNVTCVACRSGLCLTTWDRVTVVGLEVNKTNAKLGRRANKVLDAIFSGLGLVTRSPGSGRVWHDTAWAINTYSRLGPRSSTLKVLQPLDGSSSIFLIFKLLQRWRFCLALIVKTFQWHFTAQHWETEQKPLRLCLVVNLSEILAK